MSKFRLGAFCFNKRHIYNHFKILIHEKIIFLFVALFIAISANSQTTGKAGPKVTWTLSEDGKLTISGDGVMVKDEGYLGYKSFNLIDKINEVVIEEGVTAICEAAFQNCRNMTRVSIPKTITRVDRCAFLGCTNLDSISFPFYCVVKQLGEQVFANCKNLKSVELPRLLISIPIGCFTNCESLTCITIPDFCTTIDHAYDYQNGAFENCRLLEKINFGKGLTKIGGKAFRGCHSLRIIEFPIGINFISSLAFADCASLERLIIRGSMEIEEGAFGACPSLRWVTTFANPKNYKGLIYKENITLVMREAYIGSMYEYNQSTYSYKKIAKCELVFFNDVTLMPNAYGKIEPDTCWAVSGKTIKLKVTPMDGYECTQLVLNKGVLPYVAPGQRKKLTKNTKKAFIIPGNSFTMPNYDCTITGYFEPKK